MDKLLESLWKIFRAFPNFLVAIGLLTVAIAAVGGVPGKFNVPADGKVPLICLGAFLIVCGLAIYVWEHTRKEVNVLRDGVERLIDVRILNPRENALVDQQVDADGTASIKKIPKGYALRLLRGYPDQGGVVPTGQIQTDAHNGTWRVYDFNVGGEAGRKPNDRRSLEIWLVGKDGDALLECWREAHRVHSIAMEQLKSSTGKYGQWLDPIKTTTADMVRCAKVDLLRK